MRLFLPVVVAGVGLPALLCAVLPLWSGPQEQVTVASPGNGQVVLAVAEGQAVAEGDVLFELAVAGLGEELNQAQIALAKADADVKDLEVRSRVDQLEQDLNLQGAEWDLEAAQLRLEQVKAGIAKRTGELERQVHLAETTQEAFRIEAESIASRRKMGQASEGEARNAALAAERAKIEREDLVTELEYFKTYEAPLDQKEAEQTLVGRRVALERQQLIAGLQRQRTDAQLASLKLRLQMAQERLDAVEDRGASAQVHAPAAGVVARILVESGSRVRENQPVLVLGAK